ncbi:MFS transporter [Salmonella enterica subsp. enterica serovar Bovismorbificans]|nr:MFS transporter [Salmonella enterica subsp. enterica serovar Bovismorbificans]
MGGENITSSFVSLRHRNFRLYWIGMCISLTGTWMQKMALPWLVYRLTGSSLLLSVTGILQFTPMLVLSLFVGVLIDRLPKRNVLIVTQSLSLVITTLLALLVWADAVRYWHILCSAAALGITNAVDIPSRQAIIVDLTGKKDLKNAVALNFIAFNLARVAGPVIAGIVMARFGAAFCFFFNAASFAGVVISLCFIRITSVTMPETKNIVVTNLIKEGLCYIYGNRTILSTMFILAVMYTFAPNFGVLVPVFAKDVLGQNETGFGLLMSFMGGGAFLGAVSMAALSQYGVEWFFIRITPLIVGGLLVAVGCTSTFLPTALLLFSVSFGFVVFTSSANSALQLHSGDEYRSRVMSVYTIISSGSAPAGNLYAGLFTYCFNARIGFIACGTIILVLIVPVCVRGRSPC